MRAQPLVIQLTSAIVLSVGLLQVTVAQDSAKMAAPTTAPIKSASPGQAELKRVFREISSSPKQNEKLVTLVSKGDGAGAMKLLVAHGLKLGKFEKVVVLRKIRKQESAIPNVIFLAVGVPPTPQPQVALGLVYIGGYGWVDWNTFDPWMY